VRERGPYRTVIERDADRHVREPCDTPGTFPSAQSTVERHEFPWCCPSPFLMCPLRRSEDEYFGESSESVADDAPDPDDVADADEVISAITTV
jgi:hypothetical protein